MCSDCMSFVQLKEAYGGSGYVVLVCSKCVLGLNLDYLIVGFEYNFGARYIYNTCMYKLFR